MRLNLIRNQEESLSPNEIQKSVEDYNLPTLFQGYVFTFYAPCSKICQPKIKNPRQVSQTGIKIEWYVNSCCVAESSGYSFNNNFPPVKDGDIVSQEDDLDNDNKNCTRAKQLKNAAGDDFSSKEGWTKYTIMPPCAKEDEKKPDQEAPGPDGSLNGTQAIGVGASGVAVVGATVMLGVAAAKRQRNKDTVGESNLY